jgi:hypothetical protein
MCRYMIGRTVGEAAASRAAGEPAVLARPNPARLVDPPRCRCACPHRRSHAVRSPMRMPRAAGEADPGRAVGEAAAFRAAGEPEPCCCGRPWPTWLIRPNAAAPALIAAVMPSAHRCASPEPQARPTQAEPQARPPLPEPQASQPCARPPLPEPQASQPCRRGRPRRAWLIPASLLTPTHSHSLPLTPTQSHSLLLTPTLG